MSAGNPVVCFRIETEKLAEVQRAIVSANENRRAEPYTQTSWILKAIQEKLDHANRSKKKKGRGELPVTDTSNFQEK